jgi:hypothetical protein
MKTLMIALVALTLQIQARADGFLCKAQNTGLSIRVLNHTDPGVGTRSPAVMVIADPMVQSDSKTIVLFRDDNRTLTYLGQGNYLGKVDLRFLDSNRRGENIAGTKLGELATIFLDIEFSYEHNSTQLANVMKEIPGKIFYTKRSGEVLEEKVTCSRYHQN